MSYLRDKCHSGESGDEIPLLARLPVACYHRIAGSVEVNDVGVASSLGHNGRFKNLLVVSLHIVVLQPATLRSSLVDDRGG